MTKKIHLSSLFMMSEISNNASAKNSNNEEKYRVSALSY